MLVEGVVSLEDCGGEDRLRRLAFSWASYNRAGRQVVSGVPGRHGRR